MRIKVFAILIFALVFTTLACSQQQGDLMQKKDNGAQKEKNGIFAINDYIKNKDYSQYQVATFAGGCFWCTEAAFERIQGVKDVISGYSGGDKKYPTYYEVGGGRTGHAEAIQIFYDPAVVTFKTLLEVFFVAHDPTTLNRQGPDVGPEYRSGIYYHNELQKNQIEEQIKYLNQSGKFSKAIVTEVAPYKEFWVAEAYHQDYYEQHPENPYVQNISRPKVEKVKKQFAEKLKPMYQAKK